MKRINRRKLKKILKKVEGFDVSAFNLLIVGNTIKKVNTTCNFTEIMKVIGFSIIKTAITKEIMYQCHCLHDCSFSNSRYKNYFMLTDANVIKNTWNSHYIKRIKNAKYSRKIQS